MRSITIIGAGQCGLQLGLGLVQNGYDVTIVTDRTAEEVAQGRIMSSQCMFDMALEYERNLSINFWDKDCPTVDGIGISVENTDIQWRARLEAPAQSVDQRVKMPVWMKAFQDQGGRLLIKTVDVDELDKLAGQCDVLLVASGKGEIGRLFTRDAAKSSFDKPMRALGLTYVTGIKTRNEYSLVDFHIVPGVGEYFGFPALTTTGPCHIMVFEGVPGGPMDCWQGVESPEQHLQISKDIIRNFMPNDAELVENIQLTDNNGILAGRFPPTIRKPIAVLPSGRLAYGIADTVCLNDPITGQGSNNASKCAAIHLGSILHHGKLPFDQRWMQKTFHKYWSYAQWVVAWTNMLLLPPSENTLRVLKKANDSPLLAERIVNGFDDPQGFYPWFVDPRAVDVENLWS